MSESCNSVVAREQTREQIIAACMAAVCRYCRRGSEVVWSLDGICRHRIAGSPPCRAQGIRVMERESKT